MTAHSIASPCKTVKYMRYVHHRQLNAGVKGECCERVCRYNLLLEVRNMAENAEFTMKLARTNDSPMFQTMVHHVFDGRAE